MLRALLALAIAGLLVVGGPIIAVAVARAQDGHGHVLPPPKNPFCKDCWDQLDRYTQGLERAQCAAAKATSRQREIPGAQGQIRRPLELECRTKG